MIVENTPDPFDVIVAGLRAVPGSPGFLGKAGSEYLARNYVGSIDQQMEIEYYERCERAAEHEELK